MGSSAFKLGLLVLVIVPLCAASLCQFGREYWSGEAGSCVNCTRCQGSGREVVIRPCQVHADTVCGPLADLAIEWPWKKAAHKKHHEEEVEEWTGGHHGHHHAHHNEHSDLNELNDHRSSAKKSHKKHHHAHEHHHEREQEPLADANEWERWLKKRLEHKKEDLLKNLLEEERHAEEEEPLRLSSARPFGADSADDVSTATRRPHISKLDLEIFEKLVTHEQKSRGRGHRRNELAPPASSYDDDLLDDEETFGGAGPGRRPAFFPGEPSTVSEMVMDQRPWEPASVGVSAERVPFTAAETLVWDWQAVALVSAVAACLLFFALAAVYSLLHVRQWRRLKTDFHIDVEDLALRVSLMQNGGLNSNSSDGGNTNHYLEQLIAGKKEGENMSNVYVEKQPTAS